MQKLSWLDPLSMLPLECDRPQAIRLFVAGPWSMFPTWARQPAPSAIRSERTPCDGLSVKERALLPRMESRLNKHTGRLHARASSGLHRFGVSPEPLQDGQARRTAVQYAAYQWQ